MGFNFKNWGKSLLAGAAGGALSSQFSALKPFQAAISAGAGALANKDNRLAGALQGFAGGGLGSSALSGIKNSWGNTSGSALDNFMSGAKTGGTGYVGSIPGFGGFGTSNPTGVFSKMLAPKTTDVFKSSASNPYSIAGSGAGIASNMAGSTAKPAAMTNPSGFNYDQFANQLQSTGISKPTTSGGGGALSRFLGGSSDGANNTNFGRIAAGAGVASLGNLFAPQVEVPDYGSLPGVQAYKAAVEGGGADPEARALGMGELRNILNNQIGATPQAVQDAEQRSAMLQYEKDRQAAINNWKAVRPGIDIANDSDFQKYMTDFDARYTADRMANETSRNWQYYQQQQQQRLAAMQTALNLNAEQMTYLQSLAQLEIDQIMAQTDLTAGEAAQVKELFGTIGEAVMESGLPQNIYTV
jgi:hypothetical protein